MSEVAKIILQQLGGASKFIAMTGAKNFVGGKNYLMFQIPRNSSKANKVIVTLDPTDTYTVEFGQYRNLEYTTLVKFTDVYCDNLQEVFENYTGMSTSL